MPYRLHGRERPALDCWGLCRLVLAEQAGLELPLWDAVDGRDLAQVCAVVSEQSAGGVWLPVSERAARALDLVTMRALWRAGDGRLRAGEIHCGVMAPGSRVLHVERDSDAVCVAFAKVRKRVTGIYRHRSLA